MDQQLTSIEVGTTYLFFTVTYYFVGTVVRVTPTDLLLRDCSLIYGVPNWEKFFADPDGGTVEEKAFLGDFILTGRLGARPMPAPKKAKR